MKPEKTYKIRFVGAPGLALRRILAAASRVDLEEEGDHGDIDALLLEIRSPSEMTHKLQSAREKVPVIVISADGSSNFLAAATRAGAAGVIHPEAEEKSILDALDTVTAGGTYLSSSKVLDFVHRAQAREEALAKTQLTPRELSVLELLALGMSARQIASRLSLSQRTVNTHVAKLYRKLGASNRVEAIRAGMRMGLVTISE